MQDEIVARLANALGTQLVTAEARRAERAPNPDSMDLYFQARAWLNRGATPEYFSRARDLSQRALVLDPANVVGEVRFDGVSFRYGGPDVVDYQEADWVELVDSDNRTIRIAIARNTHLPIRKTVDTRDANTRMRTQEVEYYSNYHPIDGVETPFQITRERNGMKMYQVFFDKCEYNTNLSDALFTKESLDERWEKVGKKEKKSKEKPSKTDNDKN